MMNGHNIAFFHDDRLALQLPPDEAAAMLASGEATIPLMGKRAMRNWVAVPLSGDPAGTEHWRALLGEAAARRPPTDLRTRSPRGAGRLDRRSGAEPDAPSV